MDGLVDTALRSVRDGALPVGDNAPGFHIILFVGPLSWFYPTSGLSAAARVKEKYEER